MDSLRKIPGVDTILNSDEIKGIIDNYNSEKVKHAVRKIISETKDKAKKGKSIPGNNEIIQQVLKEISRFETKHFKKILNATGIIAHTNLGRAPFGDEYIQDAIVALEGYNNLEFSLEEAKRGSRNSHLTEILTYLTGAEDVLVVNNNAASILLILRAFAKDKEVIVSRGELIEIGGSFRLPDILASSDCKMVEVGTTNKTKIRDYEDAVTDNTAILFKAHKSNYSIQGFTQEVTLNELVVIGKRHNIPVVYDMGSGLINKKVIRQFGSEPNIKQALSSGIDLLCFSGDKLLGGPQAGIIVGKKEFIEKLKKEPMLRALRVGKLTIAFLETVCHYFTKDSELVRKNLFYQMLTQDQAELKNKAITLQKALKNNNIKAEVIPNKGQFGGGAMPGCEVNSYAVKIVKDDLSNRNRSTFAEQMYYQLLLHDTPLLSILKKGNLYFDMMAIQVKDINKVAVIIRDAYNNNSV